MSAEFVPPPMPPGSEDIEDFADRDVATMCDPTPKRGTKLFRDFVLREFPGTSDLGIARKCDAKHDEHEEGRAWDVGCTLPVAEKIIEYILKPDDTGHAMAVARRAGLMYMIHNREMWRAYPWEGRPAGSWGPYNGEDDHTTHIHFSFTRAGGKGETSFYRWLEDTAKPPSGSPPPGGIVAVCGVLLLVTGGLLAWHYS